MKKVINDRISWIDYLKIIACLMVFVGHYYNAFYSFCNTIPNLNKYVVMVFDKFPAPYMDGNFWVCVFCILSGYLSAKKTISSLKQLFCECILRYFRFLIPLLFINVSIYIVDLVFGFKSIELSLLYNNNWLGSFFLNITLMGVLKNSITLGSQLNGPLWMIRPLFFGNILILLLKYIKDKYKDYSIVNFALLFIMLFLIFFIFQKYELIIYSFITLLGFAIYNLTNKIKTRYNLIIFLVLLIMIYIFNNNLIIKDVIRFNNLPLLNSLSAFIFIVAIFFCKSMDNVKKSKFDLGGISFYIYLIHWPIICSLSSGLIMLFDNYTLGYVIVLFVTIVTVVFISYLLSKTVNKVINYFNKIIKNTLFKILKYSE